MKKKRKFSGISVNRHLVETAWQGFWIRFLARREGKWHKVLSPITLLEAWYALVSQNLSPATQASTKQVIPFRSGCFPKNTPHLHDTPLSAVISVIRKTPKNHVESKSPQWKRNACLLVQCYDKEKKLYFDSLVFIGKKMIWNCIRSRARGWRS